MNWTHENIADWSRKTFPKLTRDQQKEKFFKEVKELQRATSYPEHLEELADVCIVLTILAFRFCVKWAQGCLYALQAGNDENLEEAINIKMDINSRRTWALINGEYRHID